MEEIWKPVVGYEWYYEISNYWVMKTISNNQTRKERMLIPSIKGKYAFYTLWFKWKRLFTWVHRIVAQAFHDNPNNYPVVMHLDNNPLNNHVDNLKWWTHKDNSRQCWLEGRHNNPLLNNHYCKWVFWEKNKFSKRVLQYSKQFELIREWGGTKDAERGTGIYSSHISHVCLGKRKSAWWFIWKYK